MSDEDDTPPEALFFMKRAQNFPKVSLAEVKNVTTLLEQTKENKVKEIETKEKNRDKTGRCRRLRSRPSCIKEVFLDDQDEYVKFIDAEKDSSLSADISPLAPPVKRRLKTIHTRQANELKKIVAANKKILSAAHKISNKYKEVEDLPHPAEKPQDFILTISYMSEVSRLRCCKEEKFSTIFPRVADLFNLKASELLLCLDNYNINLDDTPKSLNMSLTDTIECLPYKGSETVAKSDDMLKIFFQSDAIKEKLHLFVHKLETMKDIMRKFAKHRGVTMDNFLFEFDGERIQGTETPLELDMESGNCIDVKMTETARTKGEKVIKKRKNENQVFPSVIYISDADSDVEICD